MRNGINYDVGTYTRGRGPSSRDVFDERIVRKEMEIIRKDLHCNSVRISGQDVGRLSTAARHALHNSLEVWFSPAMIDVNEQETLEYLEECATAAEGLRHGSGDLVFVIGCELTFFMKGLVEGETSFDRMGTFMKPSRLMRSTILKGSYNRRLNSFLERAVRVIRRSFNGPLTYASGTWEKVDWTPFDIVGIDHYRDAMNKRTYRDRLDRYLTLGKPVVITEFGCCTYQGAGEKGGYGWNIVDRGKDPPQLQGSFVRDEEGQANYILESLNVFREAKVEGSFVFTFVSPSYPYSESPLYDLDMASFSVVRTLRDRNGMTYADMPWEPKRSFFALAERYRDGSY